MSGEAAARAFIGAFGVTLDDESKANTPGRFLRAMRELTSCAGTDPVAALSTVFNSDADQMIVVREVPLVSVCEHHMLPFVGTATVGYVPFKGRIVGLSKIPRLVRACARRPQVQERLTKMIADAMMTVLEPLGVGVVVKARHTCMSLRGVRSDGEMVTTDLRELFRDDGSARDEFMRASGI